MKRYTCLTVLVAMVFALGCAAVAHAEILPPRGEGQIGFHAEILCEELTLREAPSASSNALKKLQYGDFILVMEQADGWAHCALGDSEDDLTGWVNADYLAIDPARYRTDKKTPVYAWGSTVAPKVALLDADTTLTILKDEGEWLIVSLRAATGWIRK